MDALAVLLIALTGVSVYLATGWTIARRRIPRAWANARSTWTAEASIRSSVKEQTFCVFLFWPVYLSVSAVSARLGSAIDAGDPERLKARIAELERELGYR
jgi:hypothetical protein